MTLPNIKFDWNINVGTVGAIFVFFLGCIGSWYDLRQTVALNATRVESKFIEIDRFQRYQEQRDGEQDAFRDRAISDLKGTLKENKEDIKDYIRDLRNDLKSPTKRF